MLALVGHIRAAVLRVRLLVWLATTRLRLRFHGVDAELRFGRHVRWAELPGVRVTGGRGGRVAIEVGDNVDLGRLILIDVDGAARSTLRIGCDAMFEHAVRIQLLGGSLTLGDRCEVRDSAVLKVSSPDARLTIGDQVKIGRGAAVHCHTEVTVEELVTLAERITVVDSFHDVDGSDTWTMLSPLGSAPVRIERNAIVLSGAVIVHGTTIGRNAVVSANALVPSGTHRPGVVLFGNPARTVRTLPAAPPPAPEPTDA
ncbi:MAG TPA: acyltransferase [Mycobacteriales bacterium]|nr:acyltransferase [Mycobacteriales bacterium]